MVCVNWPRDLTRVYSLAFMCWNKLQQISAKIKRLEKMAEWSEQLKTSLRCYRDLAGGVQHRHDTSYNLKGW